MVAEREALSLTALSIDHFVKIMRQHGSSVITRTMVEQDRDAGAPITPEGTVHLPHYAAWLAERVAHDA